MTTKFSTILNKTPQIVTANIKQLKSLYTNCKFHITIQYVWGFTVIATYSTKFIASTDVSRPKRNVKV